MDQPLLVVEDRVVQPGEPRDCYLERYEERRHSERIHLFLLLLLRLDYLKTVRLTQRNGIGQALRDRLHVA